MDLRGTDESAARFARYVGGLASVIGHADRTAPLRDYCVGLLMPCERKSVEPMAALTAPDRTAAQHQSLLHFIGQAPWSDEQVLAKVRELVLPELERHGPIEAWIIDDTGFPKKGRHSVGVARQYCGQLGSRRCKATPAASRSAATARGKQDNCQAAVSLSIANRHASLPVSYRLYLPEEWAWDAARRRQAGVPEEISFRTKPEIALEQIRAACEAGIARSVVLLDAGYGNHTSLRTDISALGLTYVAGILSSTSVWAPGTQPLAPKRWSGQGRPPTRTRRDATHRPVSVKELALGLPKRAWRTIGWRDGSAERLSSRFARVRIRAAHRDERHGEEWVLIEWPKAEKEPTKYWLSTLAHNITFERLVDLAKLRWRIERDYQELKQEIGLGHFEGRGWRGFHHHATLCIAAYGFLISERGSIPPSGSRAAARLPALELPAGHRPRGAPDQTRTPHPKLDRNPAPAIGRRARQASVEMPMLHPENPTQQIHPLVTQ